MGLRGFQLPEATVGLSALVPTGLPGALLKEAFLCSVGFQSLFAWYQVQGPRKHLNPRQSQGLAFQSLVLQDRFGAAGGAFCPDLSPCRAPQPSAKFVNPTPPWCVCGKHRPWGLLVPPWPPRCHLSGARLCKRNGVREAGLCSAPLITPRALLRQSWPSPESEGPQVRACHPPSGCFYQGELPGSAAAEREGGAF